MAIIESAFGSLAELLSVSTVLVGLLILTVLRATYKAYAGPLSSLPGPWISRWTDLHLRIILLSGKKAQYIHSLHQKYGPVVRLGPRDVDFSDAEAAHEIHKAKSGFTKSAFYAVPIQFQSMFSTRDPNFHTNRRRLLGPCFTESALSEIQPDISDLVRLAVTRMGDESKSTGCTDVLKWWTMMAMDVIGQLSFGEAFGLLKNGEKTEFAHDVANAGSILPLRSAFPTLVWLGAYLPWPWLKSIALSRQRMMTYHSKRVSQFMEYTKRQQENEEDPLSSSENTKIKSKKTIFSALTLKSKSKSKSPPTELSPLSMTMETLSYITAGTDTTAVTLTYLIWAVCRNPDIKQRLVDELSTSLPSSLSSTSSSSEKEKQENVTYKSIRDLPYLNAVIEESLRLYGAAPGSLPRDTPIGGATLSGYHIPGGTVVSTQAYSLHRDGTVFEDPERFNPDRWINNNTTKSMKDSFMAFGEGPRGCIGIHLARTELRLATALFFKTFPNARISTKNNMSDDDMEPQISFLLLPKGHRCLVETE